MNVDRAYVAPPHPWTSWEARALHYAVYDTVLSRDWKTWTEQRAIDVFQARWRDRVEALARAGWAPAQDARGRQYLRNCPPFASEPRGRSPMCGRSLVCPSCWARRMVHRAYEHLVPTCVLEGRWMLVEWRFREYLPSVPDAGALAGTAAWSLAGFAAALGYVRRAVQDPDRRLRELSRYSQRARAVVVHAIDPGTSRLVFTQSGLIVVPDSDAFPARPAAVQPGRKYSRNVTRALTRKNLALALVRAARYPAGMFDCEPALAVLAMDGLAGVRMLATYGSNA